MTRHQLTLIGMVVCTTLSVGACGSGESKIKSHAAESQGDISSPSTKGRTQSVSRGRWGSYPADPALDEREAVRTYVEALNARDGVRFCRVVAPWVSGRFDISGTDPDSPLSKPLRCPQLVAALIGYREDCCPPKFVGTAITRIGKPRRRGDVVGVPITVKLQLENDGARTTKMLEDVVWVTRDSGAWRVAKLSRIAAAASIGFQSEGDLGTAPNVDTDRREFAAQVARAERQRRERNAAYRQVKTTAACPGGARYKDVGRDVIDYLHPAPPTPTPQLPAADIRAVQVHAADDRICVVFEMAGMTQRRSTFVFAMQSPDFEWGRSGFSQSFEVEIRADGRARVTSGLDDQHHTVSVPGTVGADGNRLMLVVDRASFVAGRPLPGSTTPSRTLARFAFRADVTVVVSEKRYLHDDLGELGQRFSYR